MSDKSKLISKLKENGEYRSAYLRAKLTTLIPAQLRALRLESETPKQADLARQIGMKQSRISAMETPGATNFNLDTLVRMASGFRVGLVIRFVSFSEMVQWENNFNQDAFKVTRLEEDSEFLGVSKEAGSTLVRALIHSSRAATLDAGNLSGWKADLRRVVASADIIRTSHSDLTHLISVTSTLRGARAYVTEEKSETAFKGFRSGETGGQTGIQSTTGRSQHLR